MCSVFIYYDVGKGRRGDIQRIASLIRSFIDTPFSAMDTLLTASHAELCADLYETCYE